MLASPRAGSHLVWAMLRPTEDALARVHEFRANGEIDLGGALVRREGRAGIVELRNPRHLNAEDDTTLAATEVAVDLVLLDPEIEVGVLRGGVVEHPRYAGRRIFGAGINLTHLYRGLISYLFFLVRDLGYVNKIYRGLSSPEPARDARGDHREAVDRHGRDLRDRRRLPAAARRWTTSSPSAAAGCTCPRARRASSPAPRPAAAALGRRSARAPGDPLRREFEAGTPEGDLLCDEVVEPGEMDAALAAAHRAADRLGRRQRRRQPPRDARRRGAAGPVPRATWPTYAREQAYCHFSPALIRNLERHWSAHERRL